MEKNILIAGKDLPYSAEFAETLFTCGNNITITGEEEHIKSISSSKIKVVSWNKSSSISARSLILQAETTNNFTTDTILYFDSQTFAQNFINISTELCSPAIDSMILGFQYLTLEQISRIKQHKVKSRIIFILKKSPSDYDLLKSPVLQRTVKNSCNAIVSAAANAFEAFAENIATSYLQNEYVKTLLICGESQNEVMQKDSSLASWLNEYIDYINEHKTNSKSISWIKPGTKPSSFSLFK